MPPDPEYSQPIASSFVPFSLAPGFSRVFAGWQRENRFNGFSLHGRKTAEAVASQPGQNTRLKPGICLAPTGRCHSSPGHRPGLVLEQHQSPEWATYLPAPHRPWNAPSGLFPICLTNPGRRFALPWADMSSPRWG